MLQWHRHGQKEERIIIHNRVAGGGPYTDYRGGEVSLTKR